MSHPLRTLRIQATQLLEHGKITTTHAKAVQARQYVSRLLHASAKKDLSSRRRLTGSLFSKQAVQQALSVPAAAAVRLYRVGFRHGDNAPLSQLVLEMTKKEQPKHEPKAKQSKTKTKAKK